MTTTTRTFKSGNSIAVRIPREFAMPEGTLLEIRRRGKELVLVESKETLAGLIDAFKSFPADFFAEGRYDSPPSPVPAFDEIEEVKPRKQARKRVKVSKAK